ncbi:MAG: hypothetical protein WCA98_05925 [Candidatus Acidiferrales bacterium]
MLILSPVLMRRQIASGQSCHLTGENGSSFSVCRVPAAGEGPAGDFPRLSNYS